MKQLVRGTVRTVSFSPSEQGGSYSDKFKGKSLSHCCHTTLTHISSPGLQKPEVLACAFLTPEEDPSAQLIPLITY